MIDSIQIISQPSRSSVTGMWFRIYINGFCDGQLFSTIEAAKAEIEKIKEKKVYRS
jgi:hypothetical protein